MAQRPGRAPAGILQECGGSADEQPETPYRLMDIATVIGLGVGSVLITAAIILGGSALIFINVPSLIIVLGGTLAATLIKYSIADMINTVSIIMKTFFVKNSSPVDLVERIKDMAEIARREGLLALEGKDHGDPFLSKGLGLLADGVDASQVVMVLDRELQYSRERHKKGQNILKGMAATAPAFGMIGTLIGLVQMLASMDDPSKIGPAMAVALLTTLYGAVFANLVFGPLADKLDLRSKEEGLNRELVLAGVEAIARGENPRLIEQHLKVFLAPAIRPADDK